MGSPVQEGAFPKTIRAPRGLLRPWMAHSIAFIRSPQVSSSIGGLIRNVRSQSHASHEAHSARFHLNSQSSVGGFGRSERAFCAWRKGVFPRLSFKMLEERGLLVQPSQRGAGEHALFAICSRTGAPEGVWRKFLRLQYSVEIRRRLQGLRS